MDGDKGGHGLCRQRAALDLPTPPVNQRLADPVTPGDPGNRTAATLGFTDKPQLLLGRIGSTPPGAGDDFDALDRHGANPSACYDAKSVANAGKTNGTASSTPTSA